MTDAEEPDKKKLKVESDNVCDTKEQEKESKRDFCRILDQLAVKSTEINNSKRNTELDEMSVGFDEEIRLSLHGGQYQNLLRNPILNRKSSIFYVQNISLVALSRGYMHLAVVLCILGYGHIVDYNLIIIPSCLCRLIDVMHLVCGKTRYVSWNNEKNFITGLFSLGEITDIRLFLEYVNEFGDKHIQSIYAHCIRACAHYLKKRDVAFMAEVRNKMKGFKLTKELFLFIRDSTKNEEGKPDEAMLSMFIHGLSSIEILELI